MLEVLLKEVEEIGKVDVGGEMMDAEHLDGGGGEVCVGGEMLDAAGVVGLEVSHSDDEQPSTSNADRQHGGGEVDRVSDMIVRPFDREVITYQRRNRNARPPPSNADAELNVAPHVTPQPSSSNTVRPRREDVQRHGSSMHLKGLLQIGIQEVNASAFNTIAARKRKDPGYIKTRVAGQPDA
ncbi:hypothetical protein K7X08_024728 [Anisodus acutangulus]|uniref:Uncharacterized protein n=1 Tax=Anisodus acutangulus TaxID=402998 RepID=A0A9Q1MDD0_9SOLA|nr:hypothetical protein K7X08_024728 [Anisodus acutangulus]